MMKGQPINIITEEHFLRDVPYSSFRKLADKLNINNAWERVAEKIPLNPDSVFGNGMDFVPRYNTNVMMEFAAKNDRRGDSAAKAMLTDWGRQNVQIKHLIAVLHQCRLWKLVTFIEKEVLGKTHLSQSMAFLLRCLQQMASQEPAADFCKHVLEEVSLKDNEEMAKVVMSDNHLAGFVPPDGLRASGTREERLSHFSDKTVSKPDKTGAPPPASQTSDTVSRLLMEMDAECGGQVECSRKKDDNDQPHNLHLLKVISFQLLRQITKDFDGRHVSQGGSVLGEGGFGTVYLATFRSGFKVAVKYLRENSEDTMDQFRVEVETLCAFKHPNIVRLFGYSIDGDHRCLIYQHMVNGSLEDRLACYHGTDPLSASLRLDIVTGSARGIAFLNQGGLVHRDIKSANILLDSQFVAKVADFATAKAIDTGENGKASSVIGTSVYLAPEVKNLVIHSKLDSFSFGVVLLEILTGLPPLDETREDPDIKYHVWNHCPPPEEDEDSDAGDAGTIYDLLDSKAGDWDRHVVDTLYNMASRCIEMRTTKRPVVADILPQLELLPSKDI